jgi:beta-glucosidase-like glycosyl hydrolase
MDMDTPASPGAISTRDKMGKLLELKLETEGMSPFSPEITKLMSSINEPLFTSKAVKAGDTWEVVVDNAAVKGKKATVKVTLVGAEKLNGKDVVKIKQTAEAATDDKDGKMKIDVTAWIDPKTGRTLKMEGKVTDIPSAQLGGNLSFDITSVERT